MLSLRKLRTLKLASVLRNGFVGQQTEKEAVRIERERRSTNSSADEVVEVVTAHAEIQVEAAVVHRKINLVNFDRRLH
jgi:hypothetical protein